MIPKAEVIPSSAALTQGAGTGTGASSAGGCPTMRAGPPAPAAGPSPVAPERCPPQAAMRAAGGIAARDSRAPRRDRPGGGDAEGRGAVVDRAGERSMRVVMRDV